MIYLASPYSHHDPAVREHRFRVACRLAAAFVRAGLAVFSPIAHSHPLVEYSLPTEWELWERFNRKLLERCDELVVLMLDGWQDSKGVRAEIRVARELGKPVRFLGVDEAQTSPTFVHVVSGAPG